MDVLLEIEVLQVEEAFFLGAEDAVDDVLDAQTVVCLAIARIAEGHARWVHLRNRCECQMRWPILYQHHIASENARSICAT